MESYKYTPLSSERQEIRLVSLLPGAETTDICIRILHHSLLNLRRSANPILDLKEAENSDSEWTAYESLDHRILLENKDDLTKWYTDPRAEPVKGGSNDSMPGGTLFEALSYVCGGDDDQKMAYVLSETSAVRELSTVAIRCNLDQALRHMRDMEEPRLLWIDQICINQSDREEKGHQIASMSKIYESASRVVIWLGKESTDSSHAMTTLEYLGRQVVISQTDPHLFFPDPDAVELDWYRSNVELPYGTNTWSSIYALLSRDWFERLWRVQEVQLGDSCAVAQCGRQEIRWTHLRQAILTIYNKLRLPSDNLRQIVRRAEEIALNRNRKTLSLLLEVTKMSKCVDPRDRVYGLLGMLMKGELPDFIPDYTKEVDEVYKIVFLKASSMTGRLDLMRHCEHGSWPQKEIPSWVPNWNAQDKANHIAAWLDAGCDLIRPIAWTPEGLLEADTVNLGRIISTGDVILSPGVSPEERLRFTRQLRDMEPSIGERSPYLTSGEDLLGVHISRLCWGSLQNKLMDYHVSSLEQYMKVYKAIFNSTSSESSTIINEPLVRQIEYWASGRRLFTTSQGHLGIGPAPMQVDDAVCVIRGCGAPMVLRPVMDETDIFTVVGEAYVHGMMDGEAILGPLPPSYTVRYRRLSDGHYQQHFFRSDSAGNEESTTDPRRSNVGRGSIAMSFACETTAIFLA